MLPRRRQQVAPNALNFTRGGADVGWVERSDGCGTGERR